MKPVSRLSLASIVPGNSSGRFLVRDVRAGAGDTLWFLLQSTESHNFSIVGTNAAGALTTVIPAGQDIRAAGITSTSDGVAAIFVRQRARTLVQFDAKGKVKTETTIPCGITEQLVTINDHPATICADGLITEYGRASAPLRHNSWSRPGSRVEILSNGAAAIIDSSTGRILLNNMDSGLLAAAPESAPEIDEAVAGTSRIARDSAKALPLSGPQLGRQVVAMGTAHDQSGIYVLVWPYNGSLGPAVVQFTHSGKLAARFRCDTGSSKESFHAIDVQNGFLILVSTAGTTLFYRLA